MLEHSTPEHGTREHGTREHGTRENGTPEQRTARRQVPRAPGTTPVRLAAALTLAAALALAGCGRGGPDAAQSRTSPAPDPSPSTTAPAPAATESAPPADDAADTTAESDLPAFPAGTDVITADPSADAALTVTDLRVGHHDGYDRVVLELGGTGTPGWRIEWVDAAVDDPSGTPVDVGGDATLQVTLTGMRYPYETGLQEFSSAEPVPGAGRITAVDLRGTFEGQTQTLAGVSGAAAPVRVLQLADPLRIVIDVQDPAGS